MNAIETMITLKSLRNALYAIGGLSFCRNDESVVGEQYEAIDEAIAAVEKTIPQKVKRDTFGVECPHCGYSVTLPSTYTFKGRMIVVHCDYCYHCGQALDWSE